MFLFKDWYFLIKLTYHGVYSVDESEHMLQRQRKTVTQHPSGYFEVIAH